MIKFKAGLENGGALYGFGLSKRNLRLLQEGMPIIFDFKELDTPGRWGIVCYSARFDVFAMRQLQHSLYRWLNNNGHDFKKQPIEDLRAFYLDKPTLLKLEKGMTFCLTEEISHPNDKQIFFSGKDEKTMQSAMQDMIGEHTKVIDKL